MQIISDITYHGDNWLLSSKRSAVSASQADCFNMHLGAGPLWWS